MKPIRSSEAAFQQRAPKCTIFGGKALTGLQRLNSAESCSAPTPRQRTAASQPCPDRSWLNALPLGSLLVPFHSLPALHRNGTLRTPTGHTPAPRLVSAGKAPLKLVPSALLGARLRTEPRTQQGSRHSHHGVRISRTVR